MANSSRDLYLTFIKKGIAKDAAFFAVLDHFNELHWYDRNRQDERIRELEKQVQKLKADRDDPRRPELA